MLIRYDNYSHFLSTSKECSYMSDYESHSFYGGQTKHEALESATNGDDSLVAKAEALIDQLASIDIGTAVSEWLPCVAGAYPVIPEYLAGHPLCMRNQIAGENVSPVCIYTATTISAAISASQLMKRGTAILALVMQLQKVRPVELYLTAETHGKTDGDYIQVIPIESKPLSLAHACYGLTSAGFARHLTYGVAHVKDQFNGSWGKHPSHGNDQRWIKATLGVTENDLYIKTAHSNDALIDDPIKWINEQLERLTSKQEIE